MDTVLHLCVCLSHCAFIGSLMVAAGAARGWLPPFPYGCTSMRLMKRSRSDTGKVLMGPTLQGILGSR